MSNEQNEKPFDPNAFENAQPNPQMAVIADQLMQVVHPSWENSQGQSYEVQGIDMLMSQVKGQLRIAAQAVAPDVYAEYVKRKTAGRAPDAKPGLAQRREAYKYLMTAMVDRFYNIPGC